MLRSLQKNSVYTFINISGLSIGLACSLLILLWLNDELGYNDFHEKKEELYKVKVNSLGDSEIQTSDAIPMPLDEELTKDPGIKHTALTNWGEEYLLTVGDKKLYRRGYYVGEEFLKMFSFRLIKGSAETALKDPGSIVITRSTARALFGEEEPMGKVIRYNDKGDLTVTGVTEDVPSNSTFQFECLIPFTTYVNNEEWVKNSATRWGNFSFNLYIEREKNVDIADVWSRTRDVIKKHEEQSTAELLFHPLAKWRLFSDFKNGKSVGGLIEYVRMFTVIAIFILMIACINFMNLATARSERRAREVGIRKTVGSRRGELIFQFLSESVFIAFIAFVIAVGIVEVSLPFYNTLVDKKLFIDYSDPFFWALAGGIVVGTGIIAGSYPAFYLSGFKPAAVLKGKMQAGKKGALPRKFLVVSQFAFSIFLIVSTLVVYLQLLHLKNRPTGYDRENLVMIQSTGEIPKNYTLIKRDLLDNGLASSVTSSSSPITSIYAYMGGVEWAGKRDDQRASIATVATEFDYVQTMGVELLQGRDFSSDFNDSTSMIVNESFVTYTGMKKPLEETIRWNERDFRIVGVVKDIVMTSPNSPTDPTMFIYDPTWISEVNIRLPKGANPHEVMASVETVFQKHNPAYPFTYRFADDEFNKKFTDIQRIGKLANLFAGLAIVISCLGLFGLAAFSAEQRTKEFGIRKVLGATASSVVILISKDFSRLVFVAFIIAAPLGWWAMSEWLTKYQYRISVEWWVVAVAGLITLVLALGTVSFQAIKAAVSNPADSLRSE